MAVKKRDKKVKNLQLKAKQTLTKMNALIEDENIEKIMKLLQLAKEFIGILLMLFGAYKRAPSTTKRPSGKAKGKKRTTTKPKRKRV